MSAHNEKKYVLSLIIIFILSFTKITCSDSIPDPIQQIQNEFPDSIQIRIERGRNLEFCPDNTCEVFVAKKNISSEELSVFVYLYLYVYSDYIYLEEWRQKKETILIFKKILSKPEYEKCQNKIDLLTAKCILKKISKENRIKLFFVRYDENVRAEEEINLETIFSK